MLKRNMKNIRRWQKTKIKMKVGAKAPTFFMWKTEYSSLDIGYLFKKII